MRLFPVRRMLSMPCAAALFLAAIAMLAGAEPTAAQPIGPYPPYWGPRHFVPPGMMPDDDLPMPPGFARELLQRRGFRVTGPAYLDDDVYELPALTQRGEAVVVTLDAYDGNILHIRPDRRGAAPQQQIPQTQTVPPQAPPPLPPVRPAELAVTEPMTIGVAGAGVRPAERIQSPPARIYPPPVAEMLAPYMPAR
mgnify:CR=1 FL=1